MFADTDWIAAVDRIGFSPVAYAAAIFAIWRTMIWTAEKIVIPLRDRGFRLLDKLENNIDSINGNLDQQTSTLRDIHNTQLEVKKSLREIVEQGCGISSRNGEIQRPK